MKSTKWRLVGVAVGTTPPAALVLAAAYPATLEARPAEALLAAAAAVLFGLCGANAGWRAGRRFDRRAG